jgi:hypothetical protein
MRLQTLRNNIQAEMSGTGSGEVGSDPNEARRAPNSIHSQLDDTSSLLAGIETMIIEIEELIH